MKIYVSGPISGRENGNLPAFRAVNSELLKLGHTVVIPHDCAPFTHDGPCPEGYATPFADDYDQHTSTACFIRGDFEVLIWCDAIYMLKDWERSVGARAEFDVAALAGLKIYYQHAPSVPRA